MVITVTAMVVQATITTTVNMENTIPTNVTSKSIAKRPFYFEKYFAFLILLVSISVFFAAFTRVRAALNHVPVGLAIEKINARKKLDLLQLSRLIDIAKVSISLNDNPHYLEDLSVLLFYQSQRQGIVSNVGINTLKQTEQTIEHALSQSPANAYLWYRLATVQLLLQQPSEKVRKTLLMSIMTGPSEASYLIPRLNLCLTLFSSFSKDDAELLQAQVINAWTLKPNIFLATCVYDKQRLNLITQLLENKHPSIFNDIRLAFEKIHH